MDHQQVLANPWAGEIGLTLDGVAYRARLTLGALAELEAALGTDSLGALVMRFEEGRCSAADLLALLVAGLRGSGWQGRQGDLVHQQISYLGESGPLAAAKAAAALLALGFGGEKP